jgi:hypothetical protein
MPVTIIAALFVTTLGVDVKSSTSCPSQAMVLAKLLPLLPPGEASNPNHSAELSIEQPDSTGPAILRIRLVGPDGTEIGLRYIRASDDCPALAETAAAVLASWDTPTEVNDPPLGPEALPFSDAGTAIPRRSTGNEIETTLGVAGSSQIVGGKGPGLTLEFGIGRGHWVVRWGAFSQADRGVEVAPGWVEYHHTYGFMSLGWRLGGAWPTGVDLGPSLGWATVNGHGYTANEGQQSTEVGIRAGVRGGRRIGRWEFWAELRTHLWVTGQRAVVKGNDTTANLPILDLSINLGCSFKLTR